MTTIGSLDQFLEVQLEASGRRGGAQLGVHAAPVIAITRGVGCGGGSVARLLAEELGLVLYGWEIIEKIAADAHVSEQVAATLDVKLRSELDDWLVSLAGGSGLSSYQFMQCLRRTLFTIAINGNAIILGRGANFLLPPERKTLGLCLVAPLESKVRNVMKGLGLSQERALKHITVMDREQRVWVRKYCHADIDDTTNYHMVINTTLVTPETIVRVVKELLGRVTPHSQGSPPQVT